MRHTTVSSHRSWLALMALAGLSLAALACGFRGGAFGSTPTPAAGGKVPASAKIIEPTLIGVTPAAGMTAPVSGAPLEGILITAPSAGQGTRGALHIDRKSVV